MINKKIFVLTLFVSFLCPFFSVWAAELSPAEVAKRLQETYAGTLTMKADFQQVTVSLMSRRQKLGAGRLALKKPGLMRWDYHEPDHQVLVCDGETISMYFAREAQMIITPAQQYLEADVIYSFFAGTGDISRDFEVYPPAEEDLDEMSWAYQIKIIPKQVHPQVDFINIWADPQTFLLQRIKVTDKFGSVTDISFTNIERNIEVADDIFYYMPPEGTEIIQQ